MVYDALTVKQRSVEWLENWITGLEAAEVNAIVDGAAQDRRQATEAADRSGDGDDGSSASSGGRGSPRDGERAVRMAGGDSGDEHAGADEGPQRRARRVVQHHEHIQVRELLNATAAGETKERYRKCGLNLYNQGKKRPGHRDPAKCQQSMLCTFCTFQKMTALGDSIAALPQPLPGIVWGGALGGAQAQAANEDFATRKDFRNRNRVVLHTAATEQYLGSSFTKYELEHELGDVGGRDLEKSSKKDNCRWVATEGMLDFWHAQSVGVGLPDYLEKKKVHQRHSRGAGTDKV